MEEINVAEQFSITKLSKELQDHIAGFLTIELSTPTYETDFYFKKRVLSSQNTVTNDSLLKLNDFETMQINCKGSLLVVSKKEIKYIIKSNIDEGPSTQYLQDGSFVNLAAISSNTKRFIALLNNQELKVIPEITTDKTVFSLESYFNQEGYAGEAKTLEDKKRYQARGYFLLRENKWYKPIKRLAITDDGKTLAFANDHQVFLYNTDNIKKYNMIYTELLKALRKICCNSEMLFENYIENNFDSIVFNKQGTHLAIVYNALADQVPFEDEGNNIGESVINPNPEILSKRVTIVPFKKDFLSLQEWFAKIGVCKNLNAQQ